MLWALGMMEVSQAARELPQGTVDSGLRLRVVYLCEEQLIGSLEHDGPGSEELQE
jgi:hypothetical protein